jgi:hypothetical protein
MGRRTRVIDIAKSAKSYRRKIGRQIHAEKRLKERFGVDYNKVKNIIDNGGFKVILKQGLDELCQLSYLDKDIYFIIYQRDQIKTFFTREMVDKNFPDAFNPTAVKRKNPKVRNPPEERARLRNKAERMAKQKRKFIPASKLFK